MCDTCGCNDPEYNIHLVNHKSKSENTKLKDHAHHHHFHESSSGNAGQTIEVNENVMSDNDRLAFINRQLFEEHGIMAVNLVSSPGAGKTSLLEKTIPELIHLKKKVYVIVGDQRTDHDGERLAETGAEIIQVNTGKGCHLDARMVHKAVHQLNPQQHSILFIENVGNLVCPAMFDLGETKRVVMISTPEGEDKPIKYPYIFESSDVCLINKTDLIPYLEFDVNHLEKYIYQVNPDMTICKVSVKNSMGMNEWFKMFY
jgi:hydrogenase nickel incorporation protein HypB